jgi:predicted HNH restriction endonuclease
MGVILMSKRKKGKRSKRDIHETILSNEWQKNNNTKSIEYVRKDVNKSGLFFRSVLHEKESNKIVKSQEERIDQIINHYKKYKVQYRNLKRVQMNQFTYIEIPSFFEPSNNSKRIQEKKFEKGDLINGFLFFRDVKDPSGYVYEDERNRMADIVKMLRPFTIEELKESIYSNSIEGITLTFIRNKEYIEIMKFVHLKDLRKIVSTITEQKEKVMEQPEQGTLEVEEQKNKGNLNERTLPTQRVDYEPIGSMKPRTEFGIQNVQAKPISSKSTKGKGNKSTNSEKIHQESLHRNGVLNPAKITREVMTTKRSQSVVLTLKKLYKNVCQICQKRVEINIGEYASEVHHIHPLSKMGPDILENTIVLCPNDHTMFDRGAITIDTETNTVIHINPTNSLNGSRLLLKHHINKTYIDYHNKHIYLGKWEGR